MHAWVFACQLNRLSIITSVVCVLGHNATPDASLRVRGRMVGHVSVADVAGVCLIQWLRQRLQAAAAIAVTGPPKDDVYPLGFRYMNGCCTAVTIAVLGCQPTECHCLFTE
jgi:uncharacterized protein YejL (UPF0352 family)